MPVMPRACLLCLLCLFSLFSLFSLPCPPLPPLPPCRDAARPALRPHSPGDKRARA